MLLVHVTLRTNEDSHSCGQQYKMVEDIGSSRKIGAVVEQCRQGENMTHTLSLVHLTTMGKITDQSSKLFFLPFLN